MTTKDSSHRRLLSTNWRHWCTLAVIASVVSAQVPHPAPVAPPFAPPVSVPVQSPPSFCNLCTSGGTTSPSDNTVTIAPGSTTTCADVESFVQGLESDSVACQLLQATTLQTQCGCPPPPTQAPSPAPISYPVCSVCQKQGEVITNRYGPIDLNTSSINSSISGTFYNCDSIDYHGSSNSIEPVACNQLHQAGISAMCGCQTFVPGQSTCQAASDLTVGETKYISIPNITGTSNIKFSASPCIVDSESAWFRFTGTGGHLTLDTCVYTDNNLQPKLSVFSGTGCDQRTCVGGNSEFDCRYTFLSKAGQVYSAAVSGFGGNFGNFELRLTDKTDPPTVAPTPYPTVLTQAPFVSPTNAPRPTRLPAPTTTPTQSPSATRFPSCNICKSSDERVSRPYLFIGNSGSYACRDVEYNGLTGRIQPATCSILTELNLADKCGCIKPSGNDLCVGAAPLSIGVTLNGTAANSTWDGKVTCLADDYYSTGVWYKFVGNGKTLKINTCEYSEGFTDLAVYTGNSCNQLACVQTSPESCGSGTQVILDSKVGVTYFVKVRGSGNFALTVADTIPPANDHCPSAITIVPGVSTYGNRTDATSEAVPVCNNVSSVSQGVWYQYKSSPGPSRIVIEDYCNYSKFNQGGISVFSGSCDSLVCVAGNQHYCVDDKGRFVWESEIQTTYLILVFGSESSSFQTDFNLKLTEVAASPTVSPVPSMLPIPLAVPAPVQSPISAPTGSSNSPPVAPPSTSGVTSQPSSNSPPVAPPSTSGVTSQPTRYLSSSYSSQYPSPNVPQHVPYLRPKKSASKKTTSRKSAKKPAHEKKGGKAKD